jgi:hypothetical protein
LDPEEGEHAFALSLSVVLGGGWGHHVHSTGASAAGWSAWLAVGGLKPTEVFNAALVILFPLLRILLHAGVVLGVVLAPEFGGYSEEHEGDERIGGFQEGGL